MANMRRWKFLHILLIALHLLAMPMGLLAEEVRRTIPTHVRSMAGGWGLATPIMIAGVGIYQHLSGKQDWQWNDLFSKEVAGGLVGDFVTTAAFAGIASVLPFSPLISSYFVTFGGFLGWEIGSGNLSEADWTSILLQAGAATFMRFGLQALMTTMGFSLGAIPLTALCIGAALTTAWILDSIRDEPEAEAEDRKGFLDELDWSEEVLLDEARYQPETSPSAPGESLEGIRRRREGYEALVGALEMQDLPGAEQRYQAYR